MFAWIRNIFTKDHVAVAVRDLEAARDKLEAAVVKETTNLVKHNTTLEKATAKTTEVLRVIEDDAKRFIAAENARFTSVKEKIDAKVKDKVEAVEKGTDLLTKVKAVI